MTQSLCIPRVFTHITQAQIRNTIDDLRLGQIDRVDVIKKGDKFNIVFIHFKKWYDTDNARLAKDRLENGKEIKVIYESPWYWKISAYEKK
jgi:hypothetical protein